MMQSSQPDTASPDQDGSHSHTARNTTKFLHPTSFSHCLSYRGKCETAEQLQLSVLKRRRKSPRLQTRSIAFAQCICPVEKHLEHFLRTEERHIFLNKLAMGNDLGYLCYLKLQQNNLFEITQDSPTFLRHPVNPH